MPLWSLWTHCTLFFIVPLVSCGCLKLCRLSQFQKSCQAGALSLCKLHFTKFPVPPSLVVASSCSCVNHGLGRWGHSSLVCWQCGSCLFRTWSVEESWTVHCPMLVVSHDIFSFIDSLKTCSSPLYHSFHWSTFYVLLLLNSMIAKWKHGIHGTNSS